MKPFGVTRNWTNTEDYQRRGNRHSRCMRKTIKMLHRSARRTAKQQLRLGKLEGAFLND